MNTGPVDFDPFRGGEIARIVPSTEPQREIIASAMMSPEANTAFNEAVSLTIEGGIDPGAIEAALSRIVDRHDALRTTFTRSGEELCVTDENRFSLELRDLDVSGEAAWERRLRELWSELVSTPMDLAAGPLFRAVFVRRGPQRSELILLAHHVVCDGWSFFILLEELQSLLAEPLRELEPAPVFADFAERQAAESASNSDIDFWLDRFKVPPPPLDLPSDHPRPVLRSFGAARTDFVFDPELSQALRATAGRIRASVVNVALAGVALLLNRLCGTDDLVIGLPVARQNTGNLGGLVGHGVQLLPIRMQVRGDEEFSTLVSRVKSAVLDAQEHPAFTFGTLVRELRLSGDGSRVPLMPVVFNIDQPMKPLTLGSARAIVRTVPRVAENFELFLNVLPTAESLVVETTFNSGLFEEESIRAWLCALRSILEDAARDPGTPVSQISLTTGVADPYKKLNATAREHPSRVWLAELARHVEQTPGSPAVADENTLLSFAELDRRSSELAFLLAEKGIRPGDLVALHLERSSELVVAVAGVHKAGAAYVPLDPGFPESRLAFMLEDSGARLVLSNVPLPAALESRATGLTLPLHGTPAPRELPKVTAEDTAYVIYTSGSTGRPKGVRVHHGAVCNFLHAMKAEPGMARVDRTLAVTTLSFDISVLELLLPPFTGASLYVASKSQVADPGALEQLLGSEQISFMQATPASWRLLLDNGWKGDHKLKALCGGEALPLDLAQKLVTRVGSLWNMYGPTETTIWSTCRRITSDCERVTIGGPIDNTCVYLRSEDGVLLPAAIPGELCIGGAGVAREYLNRPEFTGERFVSHPEFGRLYRTGDRARLLPNGELEHLGRLDDQVKVRGFRIELGEIEAVLAEDADILRAAAHVWQAKPNDVRIVACCVPQPRRTLSPIKLRKSLRGKLPEYMIPQHFLSVDHIPLTPNGKIARRALPVPVVTDSRLGRYEAPVTTVEKAIAGIWTALVNPERPIGREDRFFEIGGHSLLGLEALRQMEERLNVRLHPRILFQENLAGISRQCGDGAQAGPESAGSRPAPLPVSARRLLSDVQEFVYTNLAAAPGTLRYHIPFSFRITGPLDPARFQAALEQVFARHAALRAFVAEDVEGAFLAFSDADAACRLEHVELATGEDVDAAAMTAMIAATKEPFTIHRGPLVRMRLLRAQDGRYTFFFMPHQLVFDGWSFDVFLRDLDRAYAEPGALKSKLALDYPDWSTWQRTQAGQLPGSEAAAAFWEKELRHAPPPPEWPGAADDETPARVQFRLPAESVRACEAACREHKIKLQNLLLAVFARVMGAATGRDELVIGVAASGRNLPETAAMVGPFYRNLPLRLSVPPAGDIIAWALGVEQRVESAAEHQDIPYWMLARLAGSPEALSGLNRVAFSFQEARARTLVLDDVPLEQVSVPRPGMEAHLEFWVRNTPEYLIASFDFRRGIADHSCIEALARDCESMLQGVAGGRREDTVIGSRGRLRPAIATAERREAALLRS